VLTVRWTNPPPSSGFFQVALVRKSGSAPTTPTDGVPLLAGTFTAFAEALDDFASQERPFYAAFSCNTCGRCRPTPTTVSFTVPDAIGRVDCGAGLDDPGCDLERNGQRTMDAVEFTGLLSLLRSTSSDLSKEAQATTAMRRSLLTAAQLGLVMDQFSSDRSRLAVVRALVGNVVNPRHALGHSVKFSSALSREEYVDLLTQQSRKATMACLDDDTLLALSAGHLEGPALETAERHLDECAACRRALALGLETSAAPTRAPVLTVGNTIGRYVVLERAGAGAMGQVFAAWDPQLDRKVALKVLKNAASSDEHQARLLREAQTLARLSHPNVVTVFDVGRWEGQRFIALEFVDGGSVREWLGAQSRGVNDVLSVFIQAGRGLAAAHQAGVVHRDFKPDNVLVRGDGRAQVTDFGLASESVGRVSDGPVLEPGASLTGTGALLGTPAYMAPAQLDGEPATAASDQFGFCLALFEALTGQRPWSGDTVEALRRAMRDGPAPAFPSTSDVPLTIRKAVLRGLSVQEAARWPSMVALVEALQPVPNRRSSTPLVVGLLGVVGVLALVFGSARGEVKCPPSAPRLAGVWDEGVSAKVAAAMSSPTSPWASTLSASVRATLSAYAEQWIRQHTETCEATWVRKEQSEHALDLRMRCLDERRSELAAVTRYLSQLDPASLDKAPAVVRGLTSLERCTDASRLERTNPPLSAEAAALSQATRGTVLEAKVLHDSGLFQEANAKLEPLTPTLASVADLSVQAEGWFWLGSVELKRAKLEAAREHLRRAVTTASVGGVHDVLVRALCQLVELATRLHEVALTTEYRQLIDVSRRSVEGDVELQAIVENQLGLAAFAEGHLDEALQHFRSARSAYQSMKGPAAKNVLRTINNIGVILSEQGKSAEALVEVQTARDLLVAEYGEAHPDVARAEVNLGVMFNDLSRFAEAAPHFERAERIQVQSLGTRHPELAATHNNWGDTCMGTEDFAGALHHFETALSIREESLGKSHLRLIGDLSGVASALLALERRDEAVNALERIVALRAADDAHPIELARAEVELAKVLVGTSAARARSVFTSADAHFAKGGAAAEPERQAAKAWLSAHGK
jgi:serine/threonine protein kinase/tetratricopeptide (TPR) repeat protein